MESTAILAQSHVHGTFMSIPSKLAVINKQELHATRHSVDIMIKRVMVNCFENLMV